jgi:DNA-directed RNA polymerase subunit E'/Rpb7
MDADVYTRCLLRRRVKLAANLQNKHANDSILQRLRSDVEGVCGGDGFVRPRSVSLVSVSPGVVEMSSLSGHAVYNVTFTADVCNPSVGDVMVCRVENVNSYGILAVNMSETRVLEVILQREPVLFKHSESLHDLEPGDTVTLEVMCRQFKLGQKTITLVGRAVSKDHQPRSARDEDDGDVDVGGESADDVESVTTIPDDASDDEPEPEPEDEPEDEPDVPNEEDDDAAEDAFSEDDDVADVSDAED